MQVSLTSKERMSYFEASCGGCANTDSLLFRQSLAFRKFRRLIMWEIRKYLLTAKRGDLFPRQHNYLQTYTYSTNFALQLAVPLKQQNASVLNNVAFSVLFTVVPKLTNFKKGDLRK
jgi:hypothetical protein